MKTIERPSCSRRGQYFIDDVWVDPIKWPIITTNEKVLVTWKDQHKRAIVSISAVYELGGYSLGIDQLMGEDGMYCPYLRYCDTHPELRKEKDCVLICSENMEVFKKYFYDYEQHKDVLEVVLARFEKVKATPIVRPSEEELSTYLEENKWALLEKVGDKYDEYMFSAPSNYHLYDGSEDDFEAYIAAIKVFNTKTIEDFASSRMANALKGWEYRRVFGIQTQGDDRQKVIIEREVKEETETSTETYMVTKAGKLYTDNNYPEQLKRLLARDGYYSSEDELFSTCRVKEKKLLSSIPKELEGVEVLIRGTRYLQTGNVYKKIKK